MRSHLQHSFSQHQALSLVETSHSTPLSIIVQSQHLKLNWKTSFRSTQITRGKQEPSPQEWTCPCLKHGAPKCGTAVMCSPVRAIQSPRSLPGCSVSQSSHGVGAAAARLWPARTYSSLHTVPLITCILHYFR